MLNDVKYIRLHPRPYSCIHFEQGERDKEGKTDTQPQVSDSSSYLAATSTPVFRAGFSAVDNTSIQENTDANFGVNTSMNSTPGELRREHQCELHPQMTTSADSNTVPSVLYAPASNVLSSKLR